MNHSAIAKTRYNEIRRKGILGCNEKLTHNMVDVIATHNKKEVLMERTREQIYKMLAQQTCYNDLRYSREKTEYDCRN